MATVKLTITLRPDQVDAIRAAVEAGRANSVSAYISAAVDEATATDSLSAIAADLIAAHGEPTAEDLAWVKQALALAGAEHEAA
jgi:Arc/MetJ-type ribon-helix-helix transcriptional regulator